MLKVAVLFGYLKLGEDTPNLKLVYNHVMANDQLLSN